MNILVVHLTQLMGLTSSMMRTIGLVKGLDALGHQVDFLTTPASHQQIVYRLEKPDFSRRINLLETKSHQLYSSIVVNNDKKTRKMLVSALRKMYHAVNIHDHTAKIAKSIDPAILQPHYDLVISVSDPKTSHLAVLHLKRKGLAFDRWISYWGDPMTLDITNKSIMPRFVYRREERRLLAGCDRIIYTNPFTVQAQQALFPQFAKRMASVPTALSQTMACVRDAGKPYQVSYIGAYHSHVRNLLPFYEAAQKLGEDVQTTIVGDSDLVLAQTDRVRLLPRGEVKEIERSTDLFICVLNSSGTQIPGKVYHYAASNRPILVVLDGPEQARVKGYLDAFGRYEFCENTKDDIARAIAAIRADNAQWQPLAALEPARVAAQLIGEGLA